MLNSLEKDVVSSIKFLLDSEILRWFSSKKNYLDPLSLRSYILVNIDLEDISEFAKGVVLKIRKAPFEKLSLTSPITVELKVGVSRFIYPSEENSNQIISMVKKI